MEKAVILLRVSTKYQDYEQQKKELIEYCKSKGYNDYIFIEDKESGKLKEVERLGLNKLKDTILKDSTFKSVFVYEISRLARTEKVLYSMKEFFIDNRINLYIYDKQYQLLNNDGTVNSETELLFSLYAYFASQEIKTKHIRTERGKQFAREQGKFAAGRLLYGYTVDNENNIIINEAEMKIVRYLINEYVTTEKTFGSLGAEMYERGVFEDNTRKSCQCKVMKIIKNTNYYGVKDSALIYPSALPTELLNKVNLKLSKAKRLPRTSKTIIYAKSLIKWAGNGLRFKSDRNRLSYYIKEPEYISLQMNMVDSLVWYLTKNWFYPVVYSNNNNINESKFDEQITINNQKLTTINKRLLELEEQEQRLNDMYLKLRLSKKMYEDNYKDIINNRTNLTNQQTELTNIIHTLQTKKQNVMNSKLINFNTIYSNTTDEQKKAMVDECIKEIIVTKLDTNMYQLKFVTTYGFEEYFRLQSRKKIVWFFNDFNELEELDYEYTKRLPYIRKVKLHPLTK